MTLDHPGLCAAFPLPQMNQAADWLCAAFGFTVRPRIGTHRVQLNVGDGALTLRELRDGESGGPLGVGHSVTVRVDDADAHCRRAKAHGANITQEPTTHIYGERQYNADDIAGHSWTFSQSVADVDPTQWGEHQNSGDPCRLAPTCITAVARQI